MKSTTIACVAACCAFLASGALFSEAKPGSAAAQVWTFRNRVAVASADLKEDWTITQGDADQEEIVSFSLVEDNEETLLVGVTMMDTLVRSPEQTKPAAEDMRSRMIKNYPNVTINVSASTVSTKSGNYSAAKMTFSEPIDGKSVVIYLFCVPSKDGRSFRSYAVQINYAARRSESDGVELLKAMTFIKPADAPAAVTAPE